MDSCVEINKLNNEIKELKKQIYLKSYKKTLLETGVKQFTHISYSLKKGTKICGNYEAFTVYAPFLYLIGAIGYEPRLDTFAIVGYKKKTNKWVWDGAYMDSKSIKIRSMNCSTDVENKIDVFNIKLSANSHGKMNIKKAYIKELNELQ